MKKININIISLLVLAASCGPMSPRDVQVKSDSTPLHSEVSRNVEAVAPNFVSEKSPSPATWFFWPSREDIKSHGDKLVPYLPESATYEDKIRNVSALISENGKVYLDEIIALDDSKKRLDLVSRNYNSLNDKVKELSEMKASKEKELDLLSCEFKASLHKFIVNAKNKFEVNRTSNRRNLKLIDRFGPLKVDEKPVDVCLPKDKVVACELVSSKKLLTRTDHRKYKKVFKTMAKRSNARFGWVKTSGWEKSVNLLEIDGVRYLCPSENTFKYAKNEIENFPYSIQKVSNISLEELADKKELLNKEIGEVKVNLFNHENVLKEAESGLNAAKMDWESYDKKTNETLQRIMGHLDIDLDNDNIVEPEEYGNYLKINSEQTKLNFLDCNGKKHPVIKISRGTVFKRTLEDGSVNNELYDFEYKSSEGCNVDESATITDIKYFVEKNTPILKFKITELTQKFDQSTYEIVNVPTGNFFHVKLKQNQAPFGIEYVGEFDYKGKEGKVLRTGIMKWAFIR